MITARWKGPCALQVDGHAGYAPKGQDIVCAGVSTLWGLLVFELQGREERGEGVLTVEDSTVLFTPKQDNEAEIRSIFEMIWRGFLLLAAAYGGYIDAKRVW